MKSLKQLFKKKKKWEIVERSNAIQYDTLGYPLRLVIDNHGQQKWIDTHKEVGNVVVKWMPKFSFEHEKFNVCGDCPCWFRHMDNSPHYANDGNCSIDWTTRNRFDDRPDDCPLVEVND